MARILERCCPNIRRFDVPTVYSKTVTKCNINIISMTLPQYHSVVSRFRGFTFSRFHVGACHLRIGHILYSAITIIDTVEYMPYLVSNVRATCSWLRRHTLTGSKCFVFLYSK